MLGLTSLGTFHTAISLIALAAGLVALIHDREISPGTRLGKLYLLTTVITCLTGFGIFKNGTFGQAHALGVITLLVLGVAALAGRSAVFGRASRQVATVCYSATFFFHLIPGVTETATRLPLGAPLVSSPEAPALQAVIGGLFIAFLVGAVLQVRRLRTAPAMSG